MKVDLPLVSVGNPTLFIGMPVFNGESFIKEALDSIINQTYKDWSLLISDNSSEDETQKICQYYAGIDNRINYICQEKNIGAVSNFKFVLDRANCKYFMWAAADDIWLPDFLDATVNVLENKLDIGFAFSNMVSIDSFGRVFRGCSDFRKFGLDCQWESVVNYVLDPEFFEKANIVHSVYRTTLIKLIADKFFLSTNWGSDMSLVLAVLSHAKLYVDERVLFKKRLARATDNLEKIDVIEVDIKEYKYYYPVKQFEEYMADHLKATENTPYYDVVKKIMQLRHELVSERVTINNLQAELQVAKIKPSFGLLYNSLKRFLKILS